MATIASTNLGNGYGPVATDITVKDLEMDISNRIKNKTHFANMAMARTQQIDNTLTAWGVDTYRKPGIQARPEGAAVSTNDIANNNRSALSNITQIFSVVTGSTNTAQAIDQAGGNPDTYEPTKQLVQMYTDIEAQLIRNDQIGTKYQGQTGTAAAGQVGRRMGSIASFAGTVSFNTVAGNSTTMASNANNIDTDIVTTTAGLTVPSDGSTYYTATGTGFSTQGFAPVLYQQLVTVAETRYNARISHVVVPASLRIAVSLAMPTSRGINRVDASAGDAITSYEGDFGYNYNIHDSWVMDNTTSTINNSIYFVDPEVIKWCSLRPLKINPEVYSNSDASLKQWNMEGTLKIQNPAGVGVLNNISVGATAATTQRDSTLVQRTNTGRLNTY